MDREGNEAHTTSRQVGLGVCVGAGEWMGTGLFLGLDEAFLCMLVLCTFREYPLPHAVS